MAIDAHGDQKYGDRPYVWHLVRVVEVMHRFGVTTPELEAAAWLHDVVEDTEVDLATLQREFGDRVAALVAAVTTDREGPDRASRLAVTYERIRTTPGATVLKLCDRIANVESCWADRSRKLFKYRDEYPGFRAALHDPTDHPTEALWTRLDELLEHRT